jgi:hypothetical protein
MSFYSLFCGIKPNGVSGTQAMLTTNRVVNYFYHLPAG